MSLIKLHALIRTNELKDTIDYYTGLLGFECIEYNEVWGWVALRRDEVEIMAAMPNEHTPFEKPVFTGSFYITVNDIDSLWNELKDKVNLVYPIENFEYGMREFALYDNNGYTIQFGQEIKM